MPISDTIKKLRTSRNLTQVEFAEKIKCNRQRIADWERGKSLPSVEDVALLSKTFGVSADWLLGLTNTETTDTKIRDICDYTGLSEEAIKRLHLFKLNDDETSFLAVTNDLLGGCNIFEFENLCYNIKLYRDHLSKIIDIKNKIYSINLFLADSQIDEKSAFKQIEELDNMVFDLSEKKDLCEFRAQRSLMYIKNRFCKDLDELNENIDFKSNEITEKYFSQFPVRFESDNNGDD